MLQDENSLFDILAKWNFWVKVGEGMIITDSREEIISVPGGKIRMVPLWKWLTYSEVT